MTEYKYPFIPKKLYPAVMLASKIVRETGYKNKAIKTAANFYGADEDDVREHLEARMAAGRKGKSPATKGRTFYYFVVGTFYGSDAEGEDLLPSDVQVFKGISKSTVVGRFHEADLKYDMSCDYGGSYSSYRLHRVLSQHERKEDALVVCEKINQLLNDFNANIDEKIIEKYREILGGDEE